MYCYGSNDLDGIKDKGHVKIVNASRRSGLAVLTVLMNSTGRVTSSAILCITTANTSAGNRSPIAKQRSVAVKSTKADQPFGYSLKSKTMSLTFCSCLDPNHLLLIMQQNHKVCS